MIEASYESMFGEKKEDIPPLMPQMFFPNLNKKIVEHAMEKAKREKKWCLVFVIGTKPCFYKFYGSIMEAAKQDIPYIIIDSKQHYDQNLTHGLNEFNYTPKVALDLNIRGGLAQKSAELMLKINWFAIYLKKNWPTVTAVPVVLGDTIMCSMVPAAWMFTRDEKAIHNEAGLRSMTPEIMRQAMSLGKSVSPEEFIAQQFGGPWELLRNEPFPEQWDTFVAGAGSEYMFAPLELNKQHLVREGYSDKNIFVTGGVVVEALEVKRKEKSEKSVFDLYPQLEHGQWVRADIHRKENLTPRRFRSIISGIKQLVEKGYQINFIEMNATRHALQQYNLYHEIEKLKAMPNFLFTEIWLEYAHVIEFFESQHCFSVLTDSGGVQEEMNIIHKPCMTCRLNTDRPETVNLAHSNILVPPVSGEAIVHIVDHLRNNEDLYKSMEKAPNIYGSDVAHKMMTIVRGLMERNEKTFKWSHNVLNLWDDEEGVSFK